MVTRPTLRQDSASSRWVRRVLLLVLFAVAFGYVESAVVVYLRAIYDPIRAIASSEAITSSVAIASSVAPAYPDQPSEGLLPLITMDQLRQADPEHVRRLVIELGREAATIIMLAVVAALATRRRGEWIAMFLVSFGVWDIAYYVGLKLMIDFPPSLLSWDILFLLPVPWIGPVLAPLIVSLTMVTAGLTLLAETERGRPLRAGWLHWVAVTVGGLIVVASFCQHFTRTTRGEMPERFNWLLFAMGESVAILAFVHAIARGRAPGAPGKR